MKKLSKMLLIPAALVAMAIPMTGANAAELAGEETVVLKATGMVTYSFEEEQDEDWADAVDTIYIREMPADISEEVTEDMQVDDMKVTVSTTKVILDSDLFTVDPSTEKTYEIVLCAEDYDDVCLGLTVQNKRPTDFTIRTIDGEAFCFRSFRIVKSILFVFCHDVTILCACSTIGELFTSAKAFYILLFEVLG